MASQNEMHSESGIEKVEGTNTESGSGDSRVTDLQTRDRQAAPFSEFDPFRADRTRQVISETDEFLGQINAQPNGFERASETDLQKLSEDAFERSKWSETRSDAFLGVLRLGRPVPPRSKRIL